MIFTAGSSGSLSLKKPNDGCVSSLPRRPLHPGQRAIVLNVALVHLRRARAPRLIKRRGWNRPESNIFCATICLSGEYVFLQYREHPGTVFFPWREQTVFFPFP
jgi:hypothetical protein